MDIISSNTLTIANTSFYNWWNKAPKPRALTTNDNSDFKSTFYVAEHSSYPAVFIKKRVEPRLYARLGLTAMTAIAKEQNALNSFSKIGVKVPSIVYCEHKFRYGKQYSILVSQELKGFINLKQWYQRQVTQAISFNVNDNMLKQLALTLAKVHGACWQHGNLSPQNILIKANDDDTNNIEVALINVQNARKRIFTSGSEAARELSYLCNNKGSMPDSDWNIFYALYCKFLNNN